MSRNTQQFPLEAFRAIADAMQTAATDWQWIGQWDSQRMFGITEERAKAYAARHGGVASQMAETPGCETAILHRVVHLPGCTKALVDGCGCMAGVL